MNRFEVEYINREVCPTCSASKDSAKLVGAIQVADYSFNNYFVPAHGPLGRINVLLCPDCGVYYKDQVPHPASLSKLFESSVGEVWNNRYDYDYEIRLVRDLFPDTKPSILDVGASRGELLRSFSNFCSRLSALDVVKNNECEKYVTDEYITGWLEDETISWSGRPYDFVALFDVVEQFALSL